MAMSGQEASFLAGGEFPIRSPTASNGVTIEFQRVRREAERHPTVEDNGEIQLKVAPEVSELDPQGRRQHPAASRCRRSPCDRASTTVELRDGESFAIAGLFQRKYANTINQIPGAANLPVLGALFRSSDWQRNETELVIIVTPHLTSPVRDIRRAAQSAAARPQEPTAIDVILDGKSVGPAARRRPTGRPIAGRPDDAAALPDADSHEFRQLSTNRHVLVVGQRLAPRGAGGAGRRAFEVAAAERLDVLSTLPRGDGPGADRRRRRPTPAELVGAIGGAGRRPRPAGGAAGRRAPAGQPGARADEAAALGRARGAVHLRRPRPRRRRAARAPTRSRRRAAINAAQCWTVVGSVGGCGGTTHRHRAGHHAGRPHAGRPRWRWSTSTSPTARPAAYLGATANMHLADASAAPERIDAALLDAFSHAGRRRLRPASPAPRDPQAFSKVSPTAVCRLLEVACQVYDWIVVDLPRRQQPWTLDVLAGSDEMLVVSELTVPALLSARALAAEIEAELPDGAHAARSSSTAWPAACSAPRRRSAEAEKALQRKADGGITSDWEAAACSANLGGSISHHRPRSKIVRDIGVLVDRADSAGADARQARRA